MTTKVINNLIKHIKKDKNIEKVEIILKKENKDNFLDYTKKFNSIIPFDPIGLFTFLRTYSRRLDSDNKNSLTETWSQTLYRVIKGCNEQLGCNFNEKEQIKLFDLLFNLKCSVAGRFLWTLGTKTISKLGLPSLMNCCFIVVDKPIKPFTWTFNMLMLGSGVGFRILKEDVAKLPKVKYALVTRQETKDADFIVPDSREGWVKLLGKVMKAHFYSGENFTYSCICLRSKGAVIKTFGGLASGPDELVKGLANISQIMNNRVGDKLRPIDVLDIINIIGRIVVSGNVRRSALISIGSPDDIEYINAKNWSIQQIPNWRCYSNNSVLVNDFNEIKDCKEFWSGYEGKGECYGLINLKLARNGGRLKDGSKYPDPTVQGFNPCAEQGLADKEVCCLSECFLPNIKSLVEFKSCVNFLYRICKHSLTLKCQVSKGTERIVHQNSRMGIGITGICQSSKEQIGWLNEVYEYIRQLDKDYSVMKGFPTSVKITTVKPSGCSRRDMLIQTSKGLLRLDEIGDVDGEEWQDIDDLYAITDDNTKEKITKFYINGNVPTKQIITRDGLELESSLNHKYRIINDRDEYIWKTTEELEVGDRLVVKLGDCENKREVNFENIEYKNMTNSIEITQPTKMTKDIAWFLGMFYADGSVHTKGIRISFNRKHPSIVKWLFKFFVDTFGIEPTMGDDRLASSSGGAVYVSNQMLLRWLKKNNCCKSYSGNLQIPEIIRRSSKECMLGFVDGFWRADGGVHKNHWSICTISKIFAQQFLVMCRSLGFNVVLNNAGPGGLGAQDRYIIRNRSNDKSKLRYQSKEFRSRIWKDYWLDPIEIILDSKCDTYDIEVENVHHYKMGGVVSHNTLSLLGGTTPGIHPGYSKYYIRRIRVAAESPLIKFYKKNGFHVEYVEQFDGSLDYSTMIISFPYKLPEGTIINDDITAIDQLEMIKKIQNEWSDNSVSCTVYYKKEELPEIKEYLSKNYNNTFKTLSFMLQTDLSASGFKQLPMEKITKEKYDEMSKNIKNINSYDGICYYDDEDNFEGCTGGSCPVR